MAQGSIVGGRFDLSRDGILLGLLEHMIWPILVVVLIGIAILVPNTFRNIQSIESVLLISVPLGLLVLAESLCLLSGHFDLSVGAIAGFSAVVAGMTIGNCLHCWSIVHSAWVGFAIILTVGTLIGLFNGVMIAKVGINPFLQTLAVLIIFGGAKFALTTQPATQLPDLYIRLGGQADTAIATIFIAFGIFAVVLRHTGFGQAIYAVGSNEEAAREVGIETDKIIISVYALSGFLSGLAGLMLTGFITVVPSSIGDGQVFPAFAAAVIGGVSLFGGRGKITGALGGVLLLGFIQAALTVSGVEATQVEMVNGIVLLVAIVLYNTQENLRNRILSGEVRNE